MRYWFLGSAKASCSSQILTARAFEEDMGEEKAVKTGVNLWSKCITNNSERDVHKVIQKQGTTLNIEKKWDEH